MKRINKTTIDLVYKKNNQKNNKIVKQKLKEDQKGFCAYTELPLITGNSGEIDHFFPVAKGGENSYSNLYLCVAEWNRKKNDKFPSDNKILTPTCLDFEKRVIYLPNDNIYICKPDDIEAKNLIELLDLNNSGLVELRKKYISTIYQLKEDFGKLKEKISFKAYLEKRKELKFRRAIENTFHIKFE